VVTASFTRTRDRRPRAERLRDHRTEMQVAMAEGCTLTEARARLVDRDADARWSAVDQRLEARRIQRESARRPPATADPPVEDHQPPRWMLFD